MSDTATMEKQLNATVLKGDLMGAFERFYADDVVMRENAEPPIPGKAANRTREQAFVDSVGAVHKVELLGSAVDGDVAYSEWMFDVTFKGGARVQLHQVAARRWKNGKVVSERFYYSK